MSVRVGESWTARNGHRRWVSMSLADLLALSFFRLVFIGPFLVLWWLILVEAYLIAESAVLLFTGVLVAIALIRHEARVSGVTLTRLRFGLWMVDLKGGRR